MEKKRSLFDYRVIIVSGKGGVGKSTVAATLCMLALRRNKRTLVVEMAGQCSMAQMLGGDPGQYEIVKRRPGLSSLSVTPQASMDEYLIRELHSKRLYQLAFKNRYVAPFIAAVPGLEDLISIGKVMDLERHARKDGTPEWDTIIVDAPSTGQGLNLLRVPKAMMDMTRAGPFYRNTKLVHDMLLDRSKTVLNLVSLPEEMPVNETIEMYRTVRDEIGVSMGHLFVNNVRPCLFNEQERDALPDLVRRGPAADAEFPREVSALLGTATELARRAQLEQTYIARLRQEVPLPILELPALPLRDIGPREIEQLSGQLSPQLEAETSGEQP